MIFPGNAGFFRERIRHLGWDDLPLVLMPGVTGLSYSGHSFLVGDGKAFERDMDALWNVMAPKMPRKRSDYFTDGQTVNDDFIQSKALSKWRNTWCDVISAYSHIYAKRDVFVTKNTKDFQDKAGCLALLGMKHISTPAETRSLVETLMQTEV